MPSDIQALIDSGLPSIAIPPGFHILDEPLYTRGKAITFTGVYGHSVLSAGRHDMTLVEVDSNGACTWRDIFFHPNGKSGVTGMKIGNGAVSNSGSMVDHCAFIDLQHGINGASIDVLKVTDTRFICQSPTGATALSIGNELEGDTWGGRVVDCDFIGPWENGILDHGHGITVRGCGFNGPVYHFKFEGWSRVVDAAGTSVTLKSGPPFQQSWVNRTVQIEGRYLTVVSCTPNSMVVSEFISGANLRLCHATTGQILIEGNGFDGGDFNYSAIHMTGPNSFYGARITGGNRFSNWHRPTEHHACLINMPQLSEVIFSGNDCASGVGGADSHGFRAIDLLDANVSGNTFTGYKTAVTCGRSSSAKAEYRLSGNQYNSCRERVRWAGGIESAG